MLRGTATLIAAMALLLPIAASAEQPDFMPGTPVFERPWPSPDKFTFAIIGDKTDGDSTGWPVYDRIIDEINLRHPDFVINVGDMIQGADTYAEADSQWAEYRQHSDRLQVPFIYMPGNHDVGNVGGREYWQRNIGRTYYSFDYKGCHFLVLNSTEIEVKGTAAFSEEQIAWARNDLATHSDARHTFVLLHHPAWICERPLRDGWEPIEQALGDRRYTVFHGHTHGYDLTWRNGHRCFCTAMTGCFGVGYTSAPQMGQFDHYALVTVDGDSAYVSIHAPGKAYREDISTPGFREAVFSIVGLDTDAEGINEPTTSVAATLRLRNPLEEPVSVSARWFMRHTDWTMDSPAARYFLDSLAVVLPPGATRDTTVILTAPSDRLIPLPLFAYSTTTASGEPLVRGMQPLNLLPDNAMRRPTEWSFVGPFDGGQMDMEGALSDPRTALAGIYREFGPESGWSATSTYETDSGAVGWRAIGLDGRDQVDLAERMGMGEQKVGFLLLGIRSPDARRVLGRIAVNDFAAISLNGQPLHENYVYALQRGHGFVPLELQEGWNTLVVRAVNLGRRWWVDFGIGDSEGVLEFAPHPPAR